MKFNFLLKKVLNEPKVKDLLDKNYFLGSIFCMPKVSNKNKIEIDQWTGHFYNPDTDNVISVDFLGKIVISGEEKAVKPMTELEQIKFIDPNLIIEKFVKNLKAGIGNIMVTLHNKKVNKKNKAVWSLVFVLITLNVLSFDIDAKTGKTLKTTKSSLVKRVSKAS